MTFVEPKISYLSERWITKNRRLCDGTPRAERGYRPKFMAVYEWRLREYKPHVDRRIIVGPLFKSEAEAKAWRPSVGLFSDTWGIA